jgi:iron complex outermembrane receptor protein
MFKQIIAGATLLTVAACSANPAPRPARSAGEADQVSIGYGKQDRRSVAAAINSITRKDLEHQEGRSLEDLIRARVPGAQIVRMQGGFNVRLRGLSTITGNSNALVVLDGVPLHEASAHMVLGTLQPRDVQRIDVVKDGSAAIYGIRGANGVIVIESRGARD